MSELGLVAAFLGGALALLSPCSALLLPSFFAYAFSDPRALVVRTTVFWVGLCLTLVPLGVGSGAVSALFYGHRQELITVAGWAVVGLGVVQLLGGGFAIPGLDRLRGRAGGRLASGGGVLSVLALGAVYGLAGFCAGPILGAVLTIAATSGEPVTGGVLLAVYALGMAAPMFVLALLWDRFDLGRRRWLRGREITVGRLRLHTTSMLSGAVFVLVGLVFLAYDGTAGLSGVLGLGGSTDMESRAQEWVLTLPGGGLEIAVLLVLATILAAVVWRRWRDPGAAGQADQGTQSAADPSSAEPVTHVVPDRRHDP